MSSEHIESYRGRAYVVRRVTGSAATSAYRCPGCQQTIRPATPHTVAWPELPTTFDRDATGLDERRHWHHGCWAARDHRH
ncbi:MAG: hypothetical protein ABI776_13220 [Nocardioidaceae bacterium]